MNKQDGPELMQRLGQLAEALAPGKAPSGNAMLVWLDVLGECPKFDVLAALTDWPKTNTRMPLPADILRICRTKVSDRLERTAKENLGATMTLDQLVVMAGKLQRDPATKAAYEKFLKRFERFRADESAPRDHKEWARVLRVREEAGDTLLPIQMENWRAALGYRRNASLEQIAQQDDDRIKL